MSSNIKQIGENLYTGYVSKDKAFAVEITAGEPPRFAPEDAFSKPRALTRSAAVAGKKEAQQVAFAQWGKDNLLPNHLLTLVLNNNLAPGVMDTKDAIVLGDDLVFYYEDYVDGKRAKVPFYDEELEEWLVTAGIEEYLAEAVIDYNYFFNVFAKLSYGNPESNKFADKITKITHLEALDTRAAIMDAKEKRIMWYGLADWASKKASDQVQLLPAYNPKADKQAQEFVVHCKKRTPGNPYYALPTWIGAQHWIRHANKIPLWKTSQMDNSANIKYHIQIPERYFMEQYPDPEFTREDRQKKRAEIIDRIITVLSGAENAGKTFVSEFAIDRQTGKELPGWKIEPIKNDIPHEAYSKDFADSNSAILSAFGTDPSLTGVILGETMGGGSGSKERLAFEIAIRKSRYARTICLHPVDTAMQINGTHIREIPNVGKRRVYLGITDQVFTTLDTNPTGKTDAI